jgi:hypothetical protein
LDGVEDGEQVEDVVSAVGEADGFAGGEVSVM